MKQLSNLPEIKFKVMIIKMLSLERRVNKLRENKNIYTKHKKEPITDEEYNN